MTKSFLRRAYNRLLHQLARLLPGATSLRPFLHRLRGVKIYGRIFIGASCVIAASPGKTLSIGKGSVLGIASLVTSDVPPHTFYSGEKAKPIATVTAPFTVDTSYEHFVRGLRPLPRRKL